MTDITMTISAPNGVVVGSVDGQNEPTGAITVTDLALTGAVDIYGGTAVTVTTFSTSGVKIGNQIAAADPTGAVTVTDNALTGAVQVAGGTAVTITTASNGGVVVGTAAGIIGTESSGAVTITDSAATGALDVYGGAAVTLTTSSGCPIAIGAAGAIGADPTGNVTITNLVHGIFGASIATLYTDGGNSVTIAGTSGDHITDTSTSQVLGNVTLDGVGGTTTITAASPQLTLTAEDGALTSRDTVVGSAGHALSLVVGTTTNTTTSYANITDSNATIINVSDTGTFADNLTLTATAARSITLGAHIGWDSLHVGTVAAGAIAPSVVITGAIMGDSLSFAASATSNVALTGTEQAGVMAAASLAMALGIVDAYGSTGAQSVTAFQYGGNTYVLESVAKGSGTLQAGDSLIELIGVHTLAAPVAGAFHLLS